MQISSAGFVYGIPSRMRHRTRKGYKWSESQCAPQSDASSIENIQAVNTHPLQRASRHLTGGPFAHFVLMQMKFASFTFS